MQQHAIACAANRSAPRVPGTHPFRFMPPENRFPEPLLLYGTFGGSIPLALGALRATMDPGLWNPSLRSGPQNPLSPQDPPPPAWWSKKDHHFGGVRCKVVGEWGGSAHQPDPTAQSVDRVDAAPHATHPGLAGGHRPRSRGGSAVRRAPFPSRLSPRPQVEWLAGKCRLGESGRE